MRQTQALANSAEKINKNDTKLSRDLYFLLFRSAKKKSVFKENKVLFNTANEKKINILTEKILHKNENPQTPIKFRQNKTEKDLTIDTMGNTEKYRGNFFLLSQPFFTYSH